LTVEKVGAFVTQVTLGSSRASKAVSRAGQTYIRVEGFVLAIPTVRNTLAILKEVIGHTVGAAG